MAEAQRFSHIKVSDADDDIVIQAGAVSAAAPEEAAAPAERPQPVEPAAAPPARAVEVCFGANSVEELVSTEMGTDQ